MLYISPPFGNYFSYQKSLRIEGTFTWERRKGLIYHTLRSLRPVRGGWVNRIGFRNKGIRRRAEGCPLSNITSICAMEPNEWGKMCEFLPSTAHLELNLSCPNVHDVDIDDANLRAFVDKFDKLQVKIRPTPTFVKQIVPRLIAMGVKTIHMSNTIPSPKGGISGKQLKEINLPLIEMTAANTTIIAGGGIYTAQDVQDYRNAGAKHFSVSTVFITRPMSLPAIYKETLKEI